MTALLEELKRRKVVRAGLVYAAAAFAVLQAADLLAAGLHLPEWVFPTITVMVVLGFPLSLVLAWTFDMTASGVQRAESEPAIAAPAWVGRGTLLGASAMLGLGAVLAAGWIALPDRPLVMAHDEGAVTRTYVVAQIESMNVDVRMVLDRFAVSPDGRSVVMVGLDRTGAGGLQLRQAGRLEPALIPGTTDRSISPVFSPDGRWIAWYESTAGALMKAQVGGNTTPVRLAGIGSGGRMTWGADDRIRVGVHNRLIAVHAVSGAADTLAFGNDTTVTRGDLLPRGRLLLSIVVADTLHRVLVRERNGRLRELLEGSDARWSSSGHIVFVRHEGGQRVLMGATLDPRSATLPSELLTLQRDAAGVQSTQAAITARGDLVYLSGVDRADRRIVLLDRRGFEREVVGAERPWEGARPSPDGSLLATTVLQEGGRRIWTVAVATGAMNPVTHSGDAFGPVWMPDGRHIVYTNIQGQRANGGSLVRAPADGSARGVALWPENSAYTQDVSSDGGLLVFRSTQRSRVELLPLQPGSSPRPLLATPLDEGRATLSPDLRWAAFRTHAAGRAELRIGPLGDPGSGVPVTRAEADPVGWSRDGRFFYRTGNEVWELRPGAPGSLPGSATRAFTLPEDVVRTPWIMPEGEHLVVIRGGRLSTDVIVVEGALRRSRRE